MSREEIETLCKYAEEMMENALQNPQMEKKLLDLADSHLNTLLERWKVECIDTETGFIHSRLGLVKFAKKDYEGARKCFLNALSNLIVRGEYCKDRALSHWQLGRTFLQLENKIEAKENLIRAINIYDSLAMFEKLRLLQSDMDILGLKIEDYLPAKEVDKDGIPVKCRECGHNEFIMTEQVENRWTYECKNCGCRNVVLKEMIPPIEQ